MRFLNIALVLAAVASAAPSAENPLERRLDCVTVFFPDTCPPSHPLSCNGAGSITLCCKSCT
ncbi:hypothetical protein BDV29DRAFT_167426 [Aspergillus leporis]|uniref:Uncharacterized protein n=1 Tax=Aspergillus leporis TaxID=41062 RepID=A0A5N5XD15_9EURO|nr:hypothetical protein BDV29DRAFT_167426 [Aspergillus leporis]